eukprot:2780853-Rhodomonas_salina.1
METEAVGCPLSPVPNIGRATSVAHPSPVQTCRVCIAPCPISVLPRTRVCIAPCPISVLPHTRP